MLALIVNSELVVGLTALGDRFSSERDVARLLAERGIPILGRIPSSRSRPDLLDAFRELRTNLIVHQETPERLRIAVTGVEPRAGKTFVSVHAAQSLADLGFETVLIDADLRAPSVHRVLGLDRSPGLTEVLLDGAEPAVDRSEEGSLQVITAGRPVEDAVGLLAGPDFEVLLDKLAATSFVHGRHAAGRAVRRRRRGRPLLRRLPARRPGRRRSPWRPRGDDRPARPGRRAAPRRGAQPQPAAGQPLHVRPAPPVVQPDAASVAAAAVARTSEPGRRDPMRILLISNLWPPHILGGAEVYTEMLGDRLAAAGHEVGAITLGYDGELVIATVPAWPYPPHTLREQPVWKRLLAHSADMYRPGAAQGDPGGGRAPSSPTSCTPTPCRGSRSPR